MLQPEASEVTRKVSLHWQRASADLRPAKQKNPKSCRNNPNISQIRSSKHKQNSAVKTSRMFVLQIHYNTIQPVQLTPKYADSRQYTVPKSKKIHQANRLVCRAWAAIGLLRSISRALSLYPPKCPSSSTRSSRTLNTKQQPKEEKGLVCDCARVPWGAAQGDMIKEDVGATAQSSFPYGVGRAPRSTPLLQSWTARHRDSLSSEALAISCEW